MGERQKTKSPVAKRLKEARTSAGISQKSLGIKAGIDEFSASARINQYERDKHVPDYATAKRLAKALRVPVTYFFADNDELAKFILLFSRSTTSEKAKIFKILQE